MENELIQIYNATLGKVTGHLMSKDDNGETVATCSENGHFVKFPAWGSLEGHVSAHNEANQGTVPLDPRTAPIPTSTDVADV